MTSDNLSFFTQRKRPQWEIVDIKASITEAAIDVQAIAPSNPIDGLLELPASELLTFGDANWLRMAVSNLLLNAIEHSPSSAGIAVKAKKLNQTIEIQVSDQGPGIVPGIEYKIFKPFYTTRPGATGLGLANVRMVMEKHGGGIRVGSHPEGGAAFTLILQALQRQKAA
ncbi:MAG: hypothetical protein CMJ76_07425 [Planctomycetaceae bacterium]|nr:hypothetical protein [Planctomycetaceae bacterium]|tara:strand:+ start:443 stop:949 length:507 start_codon:yes stop_codon:yes gene_type:complete